MKYLVQFSTSTCAQCNILKTKINKLIEDKAIDIKYQYVNLLKFDTYDDEVKNLWKHNPGLNSVPIVVIVNKEDDKFKEPEFFNNLSYTEIQNIEEFINEFTNTNEV